MQYGAEKRSSSGEHAALRWRPPAMIASGMLIVIAVFYVLREHWSHPAGALPYLLLLLCPLMHVFMH